jgi:ribonuclease Z
VTHPIHCYYPASGKKYFDRLRYSCIYRENIEVIEHPVKKAGLVEDNGKFRIEAAFLDHGVENIGWRITEPDIVKFEKDKLKALKLDGPIIRDLERDGKITHDGRIIALEEVSHVRPGDAFAYVIDTRPCKGALLLAKGAKLLLSEATYLDAERDMAHEYHHMTASQAAQLAQEAGVQMLVLTHFSARYRDLEEFGIEARKIFPHTFVADDLKRFPFPR